MGMPKKKMENKRSTRNLSNPDDNNTTFFLRSENQYLRKKNEDLAKALAETKIEHQKLIQNSVESYKKLYAMDVQSLKFKEFLKSLSLDMQIYIQQFLSLTEQMTNMLNKVNTVIHSPDNLSNISIQNTSTHSSKTMAVMPMVSGHTILSPKINLPRVSVKQLTDMMNSSQSNSMISTSRIEADEIEFADNVSSNNEDISDNISDPVPDAPNVRLDTLEEETEDEDEANEQVTTQPLLSGVFKDVRVYISPLANQHIIRFKNKTPKKFDIKNFVKREKCLPFRKSQDNLSGSTTFTERNEDVDHLDSGNDDDDDDEAQTGNVQYSQSPGVCHRSNTNNEDYDPLEGPSHVWNNAQDADTSFRPIPDGTSTPYELQTKTNYSCSKPDESSTPSRNLNNVTKRRGFSRNTRTKSKGLSNCSVKLQKLSPKVLKSYVADSCVSPCDDRTTFNERKDSPTILERSRRNSSEMIRRGRKRSSSQTSSSSTASPNCRRVRRAVKPVVYKEPSLVAKLRR